MKNIPITFTIPESIVRDLHLYIPPRQISNFVSILVEDGLKKEKQKFSKEFQESNQDRERNSEIEIWERLANSFIINFL